jgi:pyoverdine/dityrosine biosynthesis protein Dit1
MDVVVCHDSELFMDCVAIILAIAFSTSTLLHHILESIVGRKIRFIVC